MTALPHLNEAEKAELLAAVVASGGASQAQLADLEHRLENLPEGQAITGDEAVPIVQDGETRQVPLLDLLSAPQAADTIMVRDESLSQAIEQDRAALAAQPVKRSNAAGAAWALRFLGRRNRAFGGISDDGKRLHISGSVLERVANAVRIRSETGSGKIDVNDDGTISLPGHKVSQVLGDTVRATVGKRRRFIEQLTTTSYRVFGFSAQSDGSVSFAGFSAKPDGRITLGNEKRRSTTLPFIRAMIDKRARVFEKLTASSYMIHGLKVERSGTHLDLSMDGQLIVRVTAGGAPTIIGAASAEGSLALGDLYERDGEGLLPILTNMMRWAIWGSSSADYWENNFLALANKYGAAFYPGGQGSERIEHHTARLGSRPALLAFPSNVIPGAITPIDIPQPSNWHTTTPLMPYRAIVEGVHGLLAPAATAGFLTWTRETAGDDVTTTVNVPAIPVDGIANRDSFNILNLGKNSLTSGTMTAEQTAQITIDTYRWLSPLVKRSLFINHFINSTTQIGSGSYQRIIDYNDLVDAFFGKQIVDQYGFICLGKTVGELRNCPITAPDIRAMTVWDVTGITPTADDLAKQAEGLKPNGEIARDPVHLSEKGDEAIAWLTEQWALALGYLKPVE